MGLLVIDHRHRFGYRLTSLWLLLEVPSVVVVGRLLTGLLVIDHRHRFGYRFVVAAGGTVGCRCREIANRSVAKDGLTMGNPDIWADMIIYIITVQFPIASFFSILF